MPVVIQPRAMKSPTKGFTLVELMISVTISLVMLSALVSLLVSTSRNNNEMANTGGVLENGRFSLQLIEGDLVLAGYWAGFVPQFDDITSTAIPVDVPTAIPDPCQTYATWDRAYRTNSVGIPVDVRPVLPSGAGCVGFPAQRAGTDVLVVRHVEACVPGVNNCDAAVAGRPYFQVPRCSKEREAGGADVVAIPNNTSMQLAATASTVTNAYVGMMVRTTGGIGAGQYTMVTAYDGSSKIATISPGWTVLPVVTSLTPSDVTKYSFDYLLGTTAFPLRQRNCTATTPRSRYMSSIYYVTNIANPDRPAETIPTLVRSQLDLASGTIAHQAPVALVEGIEGFRVELGIDDSMTRCTPATAVNYAQAPSKVNKGTCTVLPSAAAPDPTQNTLPINRGDGIPDRYKRCTAAVPCTAAELANAVAAKLYVLVRARDQTPGYVDSKGYCLGEPAADGSCPAASAVAAANDPYKRHVFTTTVRLVNLSGRRETP